jgi:hypothetical protein
MAHISAHGRTKVATLKKEFKAAYGVGIRIYNGVKFADDGATLASIRPEGKTSDGAIKIDGKMLVGNVEKKFLDVLGVKVQIENRQGDLADNGVTLTSLSGGSAKKAASVTDSEPVSAPKKFPKVAIVVVVIAVAGLIWVLFGR